MIAALHGCMQVHVRQNCEIQALSKTKQTICVEDVLVYMYMWVLLQNQPLHPNFDMALIWRAGWLYHERWAKALQRK